MDEVLQKLRKKRALGVGGKGSLMKTTFKFPLGCRMLGASIRSEGEQLVPEPAVLVGKEEELAPCLLADFESRVLLSQASGQPSSSSLTAGLSSTWGAL